MLKILRRQGISFEIPGEERDCQVYFLWKKKDKREAEIKKSKKLLNNETENSAQDIKHEDTEEFTDSPETEENWIEYEYERRGPGHQFFLHIFWIN